MHVEWPNNNPSAKGPFDYGRGMEAGHPVVPLPVDLCRTFSSHCNINVNQVQYLNMLINTLRPRQNGRHFADDIFKFTFLEENTPISINISLKFVPGDRINNIPALVQIMAKRDQATSHYLNQRWKVHWCIYASLGLNELSWWCHLASRVKCISRMICFLDKNFHWSTIFLCVSFDFEVHITCHGYYEQGDILIKSPIYYMTILLPIDAEIYSTHVNSDIHTFNIFYVFNIPRSGSEVQRQQVYLYANTLLPRCPEYDLLPPY